MLPTLRNRLEFIITFLFPVLLLLADTLLRFGLNIDVGDVGADLALATVASFLTLLIDRLRLLSITSVNDARISARHPKDLAIMFILAIAFGVCWLLTLVLISKSNSIGKGLSSSLAFGIGLETLLTGSRLFYNLMSSDSH